MKLILSLTLALLVASLLNYGVYEFLLHYSELNKDQLAILRVFTGLPIGVFFTNYAIRVFRVRL